MRNSTNDLSKLNNSSSPYLTCYIRTRKKLKSSNFRKISISFSHQFNVMFLHKTMHVINIFIKTALLVYALIFPLILLTNPLHFFAYNYLKKMRSRIPNKLLNNTAETLAPTNFIEIWWEIWSSKLCKLLYIVILST